MNTRAHVYVTGLVQGVYFRQNTKRLAKKFAVTGWVRNLPDGRVEATFEGEQTAVEEMVHYCKKGTIRAKVTDVQVSWEPFKSEFAEFQIV
jgi:acylphosphatase